MQQQYYNQQTQLKYKEPEYLIKPTWRLAWGLLWRWWILILPFYAIIAIITAVLS